MAPAVAALGHGCLPCALLAAAALLAWACAAAAALAAASALLAALAAAARQAAFVRRIPKADGALPLIGAPPLGGQRGRGATRGEHRPCCSAGGSRQPSCVRLFSPPPPPATTRPQTHSNSPRAAPSPRQSEEPLASERRRLTRRLVLATGHTLLLAREHGRAWEIFKQAVLRRGPVARVRIAARCDGESLALCACWAGDGSSRQQPAAAGSPVYPTNNTSKLRAA